MFERIKSFYLFMNAPLEICGSKFYKRMSSYSKFNMQEQWLYHIITIIPMFIALFIFIISDMSHNNLGNALVIVTYLLFIYLFMYDVDAIQCYFNKNSEYYRATGVKREDIEKDKGLAGEFNAYLLSKKLKMPHKTLYNVCIPMPNGSFQEADAVIITQHNIYVLECKNRSGYFEIDFNKRTWTQRLGQQEHKVPNIYLQNEEHILAIDHYLKSREIINENIIYLNLLLTGGEFFANDVKMPSNFLCGDRYLLTKSISNYESKSNKNHGKNFMEDVYMALLPYSLNTVVKKDFIINQRNLKAENKEISRGNYRYYRFKDGVPIAELTEYSLLNSEEVILRRDDVYTQLGFKDDTFYFWFAEPKITYTEKQLNHKEEL